MLNDFNCGCPVYIACGYTDLRRGIDGLASIVQGQFEMDPFQRALFLFYERRRDRIKALYWEGDGSLLLYKRLEGGSFQWPRSGDKVRAMTPQQYRWPMEQLRQARQKRFWASSEKSTDDALEQLSLLFDEAEVYAEQEKAESVAVAAHVRKRKSGSVRDMVPEDIPVDVVEHRLPEEDRQCPQCGKVMEAIGTEVRETLKIRPAEVYLQRDIYYNYACRDCERNDISTPVVKMLKEPALIPGGFASAEAVAHIAVQKFVMGSPLYRQEQEWQRQGIRLTRQTMTNWLLKCAEDWLRPVYEELHRQLEER